MLLRLVGERKLKTSGLGGASKMAYLLCCLSAGLGTQLHSQGSASFLVRGASQTFHSLSLSTCFSCPTTKSEKFGEEDVLNYQHTH